MLGHSFLSGPAGAALRSCCVWQLRSSSRARSPWRSRKNRTVLLPKRCTDYAPAGLTPSADFCSVRGGGQRPRTRRARSASQHTGPGDRGRGRIMCGVCPPSPRRGPMAHLVARAALPGPGHCNELHGGEPPPARRGGRRVGAVLVGSERVCVARLRVRVWPVLCLVGADEEPGG